MESNKVEARKAMDFAERKLSENDYVGAKKLVVKAQNMYPNLDGLEQILMMIHVFISASNKINGGGEEPDWYGILNVDPLADDEAVRKQYKKLSLLLHPDKNKFNGAEDAFKLVNEACYQLSDQSMRTAYDQRRKSRQVRQKNCCKKQKPSKPQESEDFYDDRDRNAEENVDRRSYKRKPQRVSSTFWTMCNVCRTYCRLERFTNINTTFICPNCRRGYVAKEIVPEIDADGRPVMRFSPPHKQEQQSNAKSQERSERTSDASSSSTSASASDSSKGANKAEERHSKKPRKTENAKSTCEKVDIFEE